MEQTENLEGHVPPVPPWFLHLCNGVYTQILVLGNQATGQKWDNSWWVNKICTQMLSSDSKSLEADLNDVYISS